MVKLDVPVADGGPPGHAPALAFSSATDGGRIHAGPEPLGFDALTVDPVDVYRTFDSAVQAGTTFIVSATFGVPNGTADSIVCRAAAETDAANAEPRRSQKVRSGVTASPVS